MKRILIVSGVALAAACGGGNETASPSKSPSPAQPAPQATYMPPISPVYYPPANTDGGVAEAGVVAEAPDAGAPPKPEPPRTSGQAMPTELTVSPEGAIDGQRVDTFVRAQARTCFREALRLDPKVEGRISVKVVIDGDGKVSRAEAAMDGTLPTSLGECVEKKTNVANFPKPKSSPVTVVVPMSLSLKPKS